LAGLASSHAAILSGAFIPDALASPVSKKSPALTAAQALQLVATAGKDETQCVPDLFAILHYRQCRNHAAYCSHRKRTRSQLHRQNTKRCKRKVS
jgi:hypothetical protein